MLCTLFFTMVKIFGLTFKVYLAETYEDLVHIINHSSHSSSHLTREMKQFVRHAYKSDVLVRRIKAQVYSSFQILISIRVKIEIYEVGTHGVPRALNRVP